MSYNSMAIGSFHLVIIPKARSVDVQYSPLRDSPESSRETNKLQRTFVSLITITVSVLTTQNNP